ncbi:galactokinase [Consotaella salsifontis]|uniref:Galactokinase n=1 Tax=Consotaella salsifontis TaxID=1365950 RepID=A0A1T4PKY9_9HYPH|nr:galactokinase [Consotaella salsifontis]SJZ92243.1 galactokinase [Consotaella salsifontis]
MTSDTAQHRSAAGPRGFAAPGRVNLIGEHTDYNDGFVLPVALDMTTRIEAEPRADRTVTVRSRMNGAEFSFNLDESDPAPRRDWSDYVRGVVVMLQRAGHRLTGASLVVDSNVPTGSGLSSSAALEVSVGYSLVRLAGEEIALPELAKLCQKAENEFVGMRCGIMDQFISCCGVAGHALLIDCRSLSTRTVAIPQGTRIVICNSMVHHELASGEYNLRRQDCERGVELLKPAMGEITALRDVSPEALEAHRDLLPETTYRRCRHVVSENARVLAAVDALASDDPWRFGQLMVESHASMKDDYEITCPEIDQLVEIALAQRGVYGSRMTGGGFGGCTVSLVADEAAEDFERALVEGYHAATGITPPIYDCVAGPGVREITPRG